MQPRPRGESRGLIGIKGGPDMMIDLYSINSDGSESVEAKGVTVASCFPLDPEEAAFITALIEHEGSAMYGGGASPLFKFVKALGECQ
jgi:hypothetical protein